MYLNFIIIRQVKFLYNACLQDIPMSSHALLGYLLYIRKKLIHLFNY